MKAAIITGASVGIGSATAAAFIQAGFQTYNVSRRACSVAGVVNLPTDVCSDTALAATSLALLDAIDGATEVCLIHNAAQMRKDSVGDCASDQLREILETNVIAINSLNQPLLAHMPASSSLIYVGSTLSEKAVPGSFSYVTSKHAQLGMMRTSCQDLMGSGIHTAMVCPGFTDTEMLRTHLGSDPDVVSSIARLNSFNRLIEPEEIAEMICWAHHNPVINGAVLHGNLGQRES